MEQRRGPGTTSPIPWADRGPVARGGMASPRSPRDEELLRALARRINPRDADAHNNLGVVFYNKGMYDDAARHFELALELDPRMQVAERNLQICYLGTGHLEKALGELRQRLELEPDDQEAREALARILLHSGDAEGAVRELEHLLMRRPADARLFQRLARAELKRGGHDAALRALREAERHAPDDARVQLLAGEVLYQRGLFHEARRPLERAISLEPGLADAYHLLAFVYGEAGEPERATAMNARAAELNPGYSRSEAGLSLDGYSTARYQELIGAASASPAVAAGGELAHYNLGMAFRQRALYDDALRELRLATERGEDAFLVSQATAELMLLRSGNGEARPLYEELVAREQSSPKLWNELGVARHQAGELEGAESAYRRALEVDPHYALALNNLGVVQHHLGRDAAAGSLEGALQEKPGLPDVWRNLALLRHRDGRRRESLDAYGRALELDPSFAPAQTGLGVLLLEMGRAAEARAQLLQAVQADPQLAEARYHLAFSLSAMGDYQGALRETRLALELNPYVPAPRFRLLVDLQFEETSVPAPELDAAAVVHAPASSVRSFHYQPGALDSVFAEATIWHAREAEAGGQGEALLAAATTALAAGRLDEASAQVQRAAAADAARVGVLLLQGEIFLARGGAGEAVERFEEALAAISRHGGLDHDEPLGRALLGASRALLQLGRLTEAVEAAERLVALVPGDVDALRTLAEALHGARDFARAAMVLEQGRLTAPDNVPLLTQLGAAYAAAGDPDGAEAALRRALALDGYAVAARTELSRLLAGEGQLAEAEREYRAALQRLPSYGAAAFGLAALLEQRGDAGGAMEVLVDLLMLDPYQLEALVRLASLLEADGRRQAALFAYERVLRFDPGSAAAQAGAARLGRGG
jgi:tetratricopeptide (TPR) repeat protein